MFVNIPTHACPYESLKTHGLRALCGFLPDKTCSRSQALHSRSVFLFITPQVSISGREAVLSAVDKTRSASDKTRSASNKTRSMTNKTLSASDKTLSMTDKTLSATDKTLSMSNQTLSVSDKTLSVMDKTQSMTDKTLSVAPEVALGAEKTGSAAFLPISGRPWAYSKTQQTANATQTH